MGRFGMQEQYEYQYSWKDEALNFSNPTNNVGARMSGNVYYGGYSSFPAIDQFS